jgi:outer membrane protein OmpA-like peptidoglycan-associated protein
MHQRLPRRVAAAALAALALCAPVAAAAPRPATSPAFARAPLSTASTALAQLGCPGPVVPAVEIAGVSAPAFTVPDQRLGGYPVPGFTIPAVEIPAQTLPAQCVTYEPGPAGCLEATTIPGVTLPALTLPGYAIPAVSVPGASEPGELVAGDTAPAVSTDADTTASACALRGRSGYRWGAYQDSAYRGSAYRGSVYRTSGFRAELCLNGDCLPAINVPSVTGPSATAPSFSVDPRLLETAALPELNSTCAGVLQGARRIVVDLCTDTLFTGRSSILRAAGARLLRQVARALRRMQPAGPIRVEGHTDSTGNPGGRRRRSLRRARAVAHWLSAHTPIDIDRMAIAGHGDAYPTAPDTTRAGRAANRRIVIQISAP